ncbi:phage head closure protein [uncultured Ralstonia sp.]|jgi:SPP1 family predicted phage head-tail adaptor|uniref:phage head closure protein n=1 Tax=Ralstonia sp. TaxID=54061 RepID=UPI001EA78813|nr:phage head closure protein [uncultured Ralstonia sp.]UCF25459.1 MAG: phage head closure protein [Ralstonia sp.]
MTARIRSGLLTRLITIEQRVTTQDSFGQQQETWNTVKPVYALIEALNGSERAAAQSVMTDVSHRITVRYDAIFADPRVVAAYRATYNGRIFIIQAALNIDEGNQIVELMAAEGMTNG